MNTQQKYDKIMQVMADKTESLGCLIRVGKEIIVATGNIVRLDRRVYRIIGHPLHIGHVLDWIQKSNREYTCPKCKGNTNLKFDNEECVFRCMSHSPSVICMENDIRILGAWEDKRSCLSVDMEDLVDYIYSLLPDNN